MDDAILDKVVVSAGVDDDATASAVEDIIDDDVGVAVAVADLLLVLVLVELDMVKR